MLAVSCAAQALLFEVCRRFRDIPGVRENTLGVLSEHMDFIDIATQSSILEMALPDMLDIMAPFIVRFGIGLNALVTWLLAPLGLGRMMSILMNNAGWVLGHCQETCGKCFLR